MRKVYSKRAGGEVFALSPEQLNVFRQSGYKTPTPEEVIADAGAISIEPPEGKRAYVAFNVKTGGFAVRVRTSVIRNEKEIGAIVGEIVQAGITKRIAENADPDRPKTEPTAAGSPFASLLTEALKKSFAATGQASETPTPAAESSGEEVST